MAEKTEEVEICKTCGTVIDSVLVIDDETFHACPYNNTGADFNDVEFDQIPYGDRLNYGFSLTSFDIQKRRKEMLFNKKVYRVAASTGVVALIAFTGSWFFGISVERIFLLTLIALHFSSNDSKE